MAGPAEVASLPAHARDYEGNGRFAFLATVALGAHALERAYRERLAEVGALGRVVDLLLDGCL